MPPFDTSKLREISQCLANAAETADAAAQEHRTHREMDSARAQTKRAERNREWKLALDLAIAKLTPKKTGTGTPKPRVAGTGSPEFEVFWKAYPKKKSKGDAIRAWKTHGCQPIAHAIIDAVARLKNSADWTKEHGTYVPHPGTWLRANGWLDETAPAAAGVTRESKEADPMLWKIFLSQTSEPYVEYRFAKGYLKTDFRKWASAQP